MAKLNLAPGVREAWTQALRSAEYSQGKNTLRGCGKHCCLGVLAEICQFTGPLKYWNLLGPAELDVVGLTKKQQDHFAMLNDDKNRSFNEIADYIDKHS